MDSASLTNIQIHRFRADPKFLFGLCALFSVCGALFGLVFDDHQVFPLALKLIILAIPIVLILSEFAWLVFLVFYPLTSHLTELS